MKTFIRQAIHKTNLLGIPNDGIRIQFVDMGAFIVFSHVHVARNEYLEV